MNDRKKIYFLGISKIKSDSEKFFDEISGKLVPNYERYYITKDKEIGESRKDIDGKCLVCDVRKYAFPNESAIFVPQASFWSEDISLSWLERYVKFAELLFSRGIKDIYFAYIEEDARCWNLPPELFLTQIEVAFRDRGYVLTEIKYKDKEKYEDEDKTILKVSLPWQ